MCSALDNTQYRVCEEIGRGRFGTVYRCYDTVTATHYALKVIDKSLLLDPTDRQCLLNEPKLMSLLSRPHHPNILAIHAAFDGGDGDGACLSLLLDLCHPLTLLDRVTASSSFPFPNAGQIMSQLLSAVAHCHCNGVAHRDIKPDNILFDSRDVLKLADFGSAEWFGGEEGGAMSGIVGTPYYVAPEVVMGREYDEKVDVWSCGVILYVLLAGVPPFYGENAAEIFEAVVRGNLRFPSRNFMSVSPAAKDLLRKMICKDPSRRISAEQALRHPWILSGGESDTAELT